MADCFALPNIEISVSTGQNPAKKCEDTSPNEPTIHHGLTFLVDTGSPYTILCPELTQLLIGTPKGRRVSIRSYWGKPSLQCFWVWVNIWLDNRSFPIKVLAADCTNTRWKNFPSVLGRDVLENYRLEVTPSEAGDGWECRLTALNPFSVIPKSKTPFSPSNRVGQSRDNRSAVIGPWANSQITLQVTED